MEITKTTTMFNTKRIEENVDAININFKFLKESLTKLEDVVGVNASKFNDLIDWKNSLLNVIETLLKQRGVVVNLSDRYLAKKSETTCEFGNYMAKVAQTLRDFGVPEEKDYPWGGTSCETYYNAIPSEIDPFTPCSTCKCLIRKEDAIRGKSEVVRKDMGIYESCDDKKYGTFIEELVTSYYCHSKDCKPKK